MTATPHQRTPEETKRRARLAGAVYVLLGVAAAFGYYHAPLVKGDIADIAREITGSDLRFRIGVVSETHWGCSSSVSIPMESWRWRYSGGSGSCRSDCSSSGRTFCLECLAFF